jgi:hypothetical protein
LDTALSANVACDFLLTNDRSNVTTSYKAQRKNLILKVIKFGGSSLASAEQLTKVLNIVKNDSTRKFVVVSAPGKRDANDTKVTDALIAYYKAYKNGDDVTANQDWIIARYQSICDELGIPGGSHDQHRSRHPIPCDIAHPRQQIPLRQLPSCGVKTTTPNSSPSTSAKTVSTPSTSTRKTPASSSHQSLATPACCHRSNEKINYLNELEETLVIPGFFGVTEKGDICTFSRGGFPTSPAPSSQPASTPNSTKTSPTSTASTPPTPASSTTQPLSPNLPIRKCASSPTPASLFYTMRLYYPPTEPVCPL